MAAAFFCWQGALGTYFGADDALLLRQVQEATAHPSLWRILSRILTGVEWRLFGESAAPWHLTQVLLHAGAALLLLEVQVSLGLPLGAAFLSSAVFTSHPLSFGAIYPASGAGTLAGLVCLLGAGALWLRTGHTIRGLVGTALLGVLAAGFRETYAPGILALALLPQPRGSRPLAWTIPALATLGAGALLLFQGLQGPLRGAAYHPSAAAAPASAAQVLDWLFGPYPPVPDVLARVGGEPHAAAVLLGAAALLAPVALAVWRGKSGAGRAGAWWMLALSVSALFTPQHLYLYYFYGALAGFALVLAEAAGIAASSPALRRWAPAALIGLAVLCVAWGESRVLARERASLGDTTFHADPFMRQQTIVQNFVFDVRGLSMASGAGAVLLPATVGIGGLPPDAALQTNNPIAAATDSGRAAQTLGNVEWRPRFSSVFDPATPDANYLYDGDGHVYPLGRGAEVPSKIADFWAEKNGWDRVAAALAERVRLVPRDANAWFNQTLALAHLGDSLRAGESAREFLKLEPAGGRADWARKVATGKIAGP